MVKGFLERNGHVVFEPEMRFSVDNAGSYFRQLTDFAVDWCVNCAGARPAPGVAASELWVVNALLPQCCNVLLPAEVGVVQASTDGVFRPDQAGRRREEAPDATDAYGWSKRLAELGVGGPRRHVIRCSIIGPERGTPRSLLGRVLGQETTLSGYTNHWWNGITTLEWALLCQDIISGEKTAPALIQPGFWPAITKHDLLRLILDTYERPTKLVPAVAPSPVARTLVPDPQVRSIGEQLVDLKTYSAKWAC